ncbi:MAG: DUF4430 domain-containing protein [Actinomycetota bacterium]|nr:DUF4430 domain-containing protein [Actinomycetota bacterium]
MRQVIVVLAVAALAGCGGENDGTAKLWITRDMGAHVILQRNVPAGLTAMQALDRIAEIKTRYSGRYVLSINGIEGSLAARSDWFYFINGYEADRSAAEYRLHDGDVEWWDFRSWRTQMREPVVVGAFPEPFLHGYGGGRLQARVVFVRNAQRPAAERLARLIGGRATKGLNAGLKENLNLLVLRSSPETKPSLKAEGGDAPGDPVVFTFSGNPELLLLRVPFGRFRYQVGR